MTITALKVLTSQSRACKFEILPAQKQKLPASGLWASTMYSPATRLIYHLKANLE